MIEEDKTQWYCQTCNQYFKNYHQYTLHCKNHIHKCKHCGQIFQNGKKLGGHTKHCKLNPKYEQYKIKMKHPCYQETKKKLSIKRKQYLLQHPEDPWKTHISPACEQLKQFLFNNNKDFVAQYFNPSQFNGRFYSIDIAFPNQKIAIEVNGNQHYIDKYRKQEILTNYYQQRHNIIKKAGWDILQIYYLKVYDQSFKEWLLNYLNERNTKIFSI